MANRQPLSLTRREALRSAACGFGGLALAGLTSQVSLGHFTNLACFYAALTGQSPVGRLPRRFHVWPHLSKDEKEQRREQLEAVFSQFKPDTYQARLPEWMRRNAGAGFVGQISDDDARYIERVAWECVQATQKELTPGQSDSQR